jgi:NADPH:quinone reductase-like Zn-dependent oxidoreductase
MITTKAWVLHQGTEAGRAGKRQMAQLCEEDYSFPDLAENEILVEPIYGCWEANMSHALERLPVDICRQRGEEKVVIGNAGVVRVLEVGRSVRSIGEGDIGILFCNGSWDRFGYPNKIFAYDAAGTVGLLAKRTKLQEQQFIPLPEDTRYTLQQWAAFSLRFITAWSNWQQAYGCWLLQWPGGDPPITHVWGWGGGVSLAELLLAKAAGCQTAMISSDERRLQLIGSLGVRPVNRRQFARLNFDEGRYQTDPAYKRAYLGDEETFLNIVKENTSGQGVSIFMEYIGNPVLRATLKALAHRGVITTAGWKSGVKTSIVRALECMNWHIHVHTHYATYSQGITAVSFAEQTGWLPPVEGNEVWGWENIPELAQAYKEQRLTTYFPIFQVNPL